MNNLLTLVNFCMVLIYGSVLTFSFAGLTKTKNHKQILFGATLILIFFQLVVYLSFGADVLFKSYPLVVHTPLCLFLIFGMKKPALLSLISVLSAYLFCTPRKWVGTLVAFFFNNSPEVSLITQILVTLPLLYLLCKYFSPYVTLLEEESNRFLKIFLVLPMAYYLMEYGFTVYTDLLYSGGAVVVEFMDCAIVVLYLVFSIYYIREINQRKELETDRKISAIISEQAEKEIEQLRKSQEQTVIYRHDLRHHLQFIAALMERNDINEAVDYIRNICSEIDNTRIVRYCENETVNLILSSYIGKAQNKGIPCEVNAQIGVVSAVSQTDICGILSNAIENAIHACERIPQADKRFIRIRAYQQMDKLMIEIRNSFSGEIKTENSLPASDIENHGIGVKSITSIIEKYQGLYYFKASNDVFVLRIVL